jgi:hypothetical protein
VTLLNGGAGDDSVFLSRCADTWSMTGEPQAQPPRGAGRKGSKLVALVVASAIAIAVVLIDGLTSGDTSLAPPPDQRPCRSGTGFPITEQRLRSTLSANGFGPMFRDFDACWGAPGELAALVSDRALVTCSVFRKSYGRRIFRYVWRNDPSPTYIGVLNIECTVANQRDNTDLLEKALRQLPGVSSSPAYVPSADAKPD